jgi:hypothetical protein
MFEPGHSALNFLIVRWNGDTVNPNVPVDLRVNSNALSLKCPSGQLSNTALGGDAFACRDRSATVTTLNCDIRWGMP